MSVIKILIANQEIVLNDELDKKNNKNPKFKIREDYKKYLKNEEFWDILTTSISINVDGQINLFYEKDINGDFEEFHCKNKADNAFVNFLYKLKSPVSEILKKYPEENRKQISFDSNKKRMSTYVKEKDNIYRIYTKEGEKYKRILQILY